MKRLLMAVALLWSVTAGAASLDSLPGTVIWPDPTGDSWLRLQSAINYNAQNPSYHIYLAQGGIYYLSKPLIIANLKPGAADYGQTYAEIEGPSNARNAPDNYCAQIRTLYSNAPALIIQKGKGVKIRGILFYGNYSKSASMSAVSIDTLSRQQWRDGVCSFDMLSPHAAIVIDPFSRPNLLNLDSVHHLIKGLEPYYLPAMGRGGSTGVIIEQCGFDHWVGGVVITPSNQQNGESIVVRDCRFENCYSAYSYSQAQSKANVLQNIQCWGGVHTIIDGVSFGYRHGDGATAPMVDVMNVAGNNYELINNFQYAFAATLSRVYAEGLYKLGQCGGFTSTIFRDCQIDLQNGQMGYPTPDFYLLNGGAIVFDNTTLRLYNGGMVTRIILNSGDIIMRQGCLSDYPVTTNGHIRFDHVQDYYKGPNFIDSLRPETYTLAGTFVMHSTGNFDGYVKGVPGIQVGDVLLTQQVNDDDDANRYNLTYPLGFVTKVVGDSAVLQNMGPKIYDGTTHAVYINRYQ